MPIANIRADRQLTRGAQDAGGGLQRVAYEDVWDPGMRLDAGIGTGGIEKLDLRFLQSFRFADPFF